MNWLKKGPQLKMPKLKKPSGRSGIKPPAFLVDLYNDLRDRRLLLPIALVVVAIAAVPFLLGGSEPTEPFLLGGSEPTEPPPVATAPGAAGERASASLAVVEATPGLRDYRKRFGSRTATNPFKQRHTSLPRSAQIESSAAAVGGDPSSEGVMEVEGGEGGTGEVVPAPQPGGSGPSTGGSGPTTGGSAPSDDGQRFFAYRPNIRFGVAGSDDLVLHEHVPLGELLPQKNPILVFIGSSENGNQVAFNLTREVINVRGPGRCVGGKADCSLLILRAGQAVDLLTEAGQTFRLQVIQIDFVEVEPPKSAQSSTGQHNSFDRFNPVVGQFQSVRESIGDMAR